MPGGCRVDQQIFLDFEYVFAISVAIVLLLMYLFYVKYPYDAEPEVDEKGREAEGSVPISSRE